MDSVFDDGSKTWASVTNKLYAQTAPCLILQDVVIPPASRIKVPLELRPLKNGPWNGQVIITAPNSDTAIVRLRSFVGPPCDPADASAQASRDGEACVAAVSPSMGSWVVYPARKLLLLVLSHTRTLPGPLLPPRD